VSKDLAVNECPGCGAMDCTPDTCPAQHEPTVSRIDSDDVDRVVQTLMAEHECASARIVRHPAGDAIVVFLDLGLPSEECHVVDADGEELPHPHLLVSAEDREQMRAEALEGMTADA
jgi:hypothetical protein